MSRALLLLLLLLGACSKGSEADLQYVSQARSLGAEWALVNEQAGKDQVTPTYVRSMHHWLRSSLQTASSALTQPDSRYGAEIRTLLAEPDDAAPAELRAHADRLKQIEDSLESA